MLNEAFSGDSTQSGRVLLNCTNCFVKAENRWKRRASCSSTTVESIQRMNETVRNQAIADNNREVNIEKKTVRKVPKSFLQSQKDKRAEICTILIGAVKRFVKHSNDVPQDKFLLRKSISLEILNNFSLNLDVCVLMDVVIDNITDYVCMDNLAVKA
ncbi:hypothetical protein J6590_033419 [Homalodisca vitripennis]|nr:hypothetical protein J6590_033419 [Homalodisca vitripennis]